MDAAPTPAPSIEGLLAERAWVRAFARSLVSDETSADDLEQQAWVAALEAPPPHDGSPRGWFATVLRRAASKGRRSASRVGRREHAAARPEAVAATADVVAQAELEHRVVAAVLALDEPYRTTVLLRWYEGLPPREIAARMCVPVETVRSRTQRALARLRDDLDRAHGGRRSAWAVALLGRGPGDERWQRAVKVGLSGPDQGPMGGGRARALPVAAGIALLAVGAGVLLWRTFAADSDRDPALPPLAAATAALDGAAAPPPAGPALAGAGIDSPAPAAAAPPEAAPVAPAVPAVAAAVPDADGTVAVEVEVVEAGVTPDRWVEGAGLAWTCRGGSGCGGGTGSRVPTVVMFGVPPFTVWVTAPGYVARRLVDIGAVPTLRVELSRGTPAQVRFLGEDGQPLPIEEVRARYAQSSSLRKVNVIPDQPAASMGESLLRTYGPPRGWILESELLLDQAEPRLRDALGPGRWTLSIPRPDLWPVHVLGVPTADGAVRFEVRLPTPRPVRVRLVAAETGEALPGAQVILGPSSPGSWHSASTPPWIADADGFVDLPSTAEGEGFGRWWVFADERTTVIDEAALRGFPAPHEVRVPAQATLRGRAFTPSGRAAVRWEVAAVGPGFRVVDVVDDGGRYELSVPAPLRADTPQGGRVVPTLVDPAYTDFGGAEARVHAGEVAEFDIGSSSEGRSTATIAGRLTAGGRPLSGRLVAAGGPPSASGLPVNRHVITGAGGRFELAGLDAAAWSLLVYPAGFVFGYGPGTLQSEGPFVLRPDEVRPLVIDLPGGRLRVRVVAGAGDAPLARADVRVSPRSRARRMLAGLAWAPGSAGLTSSDGTVLLDGLDPGAPHQVTVTRPGTREQVTVDATPADGDVIPEVVVRLP